MFDDLSPRHSLEAVAECLVGLAEELTMPAARRSTLMERPVLSLMLVRQWVGP